MRKSIAGEWTKYRNEAVLDAAEAKIVILKSLFYSGASVFFIAVTKRAIRGIGVGDDGVMREIDAEMESEWAKLCDQQKLGLPHSGEWRRAFFTGAWAVSVVCGDQPDRVDRALSDVGIELTKFGISL